MKALLLAGGLGTRLRPLTYTRPKHLLPIGNRPHIVHVLDLLQKYGINEVVLLTSYLAETFEPVVRDARARGINVEVTREEEPLGTAGALKNAENFLADETFVVVNGDILTNVDLGGLIEFHRKRGAEATILLTPVEDPSIYGVVPTSENGRVLGFVEKPPREEAPTNLINAGVYVFERSILGRIPKGKVWSAERALFPGLVEEGAEFYALGLSGYWMDIGTPEKYLQANIDLLEGRYTTDQVSVPEDSVLAVDARVGEHARVSCSCLGPGVVIEEHAVVTRSVLLSDVIVGEGSSVDRSILGEGAKVAPGATLLERTVADREAVEG